MVDPIQAWEAWLWGERNRWDISRRRLADDAASWLACRGFGHRKLSKSDAAELVPLAFAAIDRELSAVTTPVLAMQGGGR